MIPPLILLDVRRVCVLAVSLSEIQPCAVPAGLGSGNVMKVGVESALSGPNISKSWWVDMALLLAKLAWFLLSIAFMELM
jgi:hypothetical protein